VDGDAQLVLVSLASYVQEDVAEFLLLVFLVQYFSNFLNVDYVGGIVGFCFS
jgi:hypothetical protein